MRAARLVEVGRIELLDLPKPEVGRGQVRLKVQAVGVCGSDIHAFEGTHPFVHPPIVLGHEIVGRVEEIGRDVTGFAPGDLVVVEPNITCGKCFNCRQGRYNICEKLNVIGCVGYDGGQSEYIVVPQEKAVKVPDNWTVERAVMVEPAAVGVHAVRQSGLKVGQDVLVIGAGVIGLVTLMALKAMGAGRIMVTDLMDYRLSIAKRLGADFAINPKEYNLPAEILKHFPGKGFDLVMDCVGTQATLNTAMSVARKGTRIVMVGVPEGDLLVNMANVQDRELEIVGTLMYDRKDYEAAIGFIDSGKMGVTPMVTHRFPLQDVMEAFDTAIHGRGNSLKVIVCP